MKIAWWIVMLCQQWNAPAKASLMTSWCLQVGFHWGSHNGEIPQCSTEIIYAILCPYQSHTLFCIWFPHAAFYCWASPVVTISTVEWPLLLSPVVTISAVEWPLLLQAVLITFVVLCYWRSTFSDNLLFLCASFPDSYLAAFDLLFQGLMATISYMSYLRCIIPIGLTYWPPFISQITPMFEVLNLSETASDLKLWTEVLEGHRTAIPHLHSIRAYKLFMVKISWNQQPNVMLFCSLLWPRLFPPLPFVLKSNWIRPTYFDCRFYFTCATYPDMPPLKELFILNIKLSHK